LNKHSKQQQQQNDIEKIHLTAPEKKRTSLMSQTKKWVCCSIE